MTARVLVLWLALAAALAMSVPASAGPQAPLGADRVAAPEGVPCPPLAGVVCDGAGAAADKVVPDSVSDALTFASDPVGYMAKSIGSAVDDTSEWLLKAIDTTSLVQLDNAAVVAVFAKVWGVAMFVTVLMWLFNVFKNTKSGASPQQIVGDSVGLLFLSLATTAIALPALALVLSLVDGFAAAMVGDVDENLGGMTTQMSKALTVVSGGTPFMGMVFGLLLLVALLLIWAILVVRAASLIFAAALSPLVFSCLVARDRWDAMKRPLGVLVALIVSKYVVYVALALSTGFLEAWDEDQSTVYGAVGALVLGIAMLWTTVFGSYKIATMIPIVGDEMRQTMTERSSLGPMAGAGMVMGGARMIPGGSGGSAPQEVAAGAQHFGRGGEVTAAAGGAAAPLVAAQAGGKAADVAVSNAEHQVEGHTSSSHEASSPASGAGAQSHPDPAPASPPIAPHEPPSADAPPSARATPMHVPPSEPVDVGGPSS